MPKFCANLSMMFNEVDFLDRFAAAAKAGFKGVEFLFPYAYDKNLLVDLTRKHDLQVILFNMPAGDWNAGDRGMACDPARSGEFQDQVGKSIDYALSLGCRQIHCMAGLKPRGVNEDQMRAAYIANLQFAGRELAKSGLTLLIEAINPRDIPGFYLNYSRQAFDIMHYAAVPNLRFQYDIYHMQIVEGDLAPGIGTISQRSATSSSPTRPGGMSRAPARSTTIFCSVISTRSAMRDGSAANIARPPTPSPGSDGSNLTCNSLLGVDMSKVGFIGLGIMGKPMAANLIKGGHTLYLYSRSAVAPELTAAGGIACGSSQEVAQKADIIITMVPDTPDVEKALFGKDGIAEGLSKGKIVIDMSSISPIETQEFAKKIEANWAATMSMRRCRAARSAPRMPRAHHHVRRQGEHLRQGQAAVRIDGQEHHLGGRQWRRPDL
jgi:hydroxypyruvate isomerase